MDSDNLSFLLIDPFEKTILPVHYNGKLSSLYALLGCSTVADVPCGSRYYLLADAEGLFKPDKKFFLCGDFPHQPLAGKALAVSVDDAGSLIPPRITLEELEARIIFVDGVVFEDEEG